MTDRVRKLWPFSSRTALVVSIILLVLLLTGLVVLGKFFSWPNQDAMGTVLLWIFIISLVPIILMLIDIVVDRGAVLQYKDIKIDFEEFKAKVKAEIDSKLNEEGGK